MIACLLPDCAWFLVGQTYGIRVLKTLCRISLEPDSCVSQTQSRFERWGINSLVIAKFVPGLAIIAPPLAGAMRIGWPRFIASERAAAAPCGSDRTRRRHALQDSDPAVPDPLGSHRQHHRHRGRPALAGYILYKWWERGRFYKRCAWRGSASPIFTSSSQAGEQPIVVDVRSPPRGRSSRAGFPAPFMSRWDDVDRHLQELPRDREIIVYCTCPSEASAARVAKMLINHGFKEVRPLFGGLDAWIAAGYAVEATGRPPLERGPARIML